MPSPKPVIEKIRSLLDEERRAAETPAKSIEMKVEASGLTLVSVNGGPWRPAEGDELSHMLFGDPTTTRRDKVNHGKIFKSDDTPKPMVESRIICRYCGDQNLPGEVNCVHCGGGLRVEDTVYAPPPPPMPDTPPGYVKIHIMGEAEPRYLKVEERSPFKLPK